MKQKRLQTLLLALVVASAVLGQSDDIPIENDNQFPPENPSSTDSPEDPSSADEHDFEGSDDGTIQDPTDPPLDTTPAAQLEEIQPTIANIEDLSSGEDHSCPSPCLCHYEGGFQNFIVDCSGYGLTKFPTPIDSKTTTLNLQNNNLSEIPKEVSELKNLTILNADNNSIMELALGSISELPELRVLKLANNRLIEYPNELKNSILLDKLEELDLGGNDMRTDLKPEVFKNFKSLRNLTLETSSPELLQALCSSFKDTLESVCTKSCNIKKIKCSDALKKIDDDLFDATLPGMIPFDGKENVDPNTKTSFDNVNIDLNTGTSETTKDSLQIPGVAGRSRTKIESDIPNKLNSIIETPKNEATGVEVKAGAATTETKTGGVDKSVIGIIVAAMVVVVAIVVIMKNWSSIKKRFRSSPRPAERTGVNGANGTAPEEVPLQDKSKSPV